MASNSFGKGLFYPFKEPSNLNSSSIFDSDTEEKPDMNEEKLMKINLKIKKLKHKRKKLQNRMLFSSLEYKLDSVINKFDELIRICSNWEINRLFKD